MKEQLQEVAPLATLFSLPGFLLTGSATHGAFDWNVFAPSVITLVFAIAGAFAKEQPWRLLRIVASFSIPAHVVFGLFGSMWIAEKTQPTWGTLLLASPFWAIGLGLFTWTNALFITKGQGTLSPLDPPTKLVLKGPYLHVRNPMIAGVIFIILGITLAAGIPARMLIFSLWFMLAHTLYLVFKEEPLLKQRFGHDYHVYFQNVGRWVPRVRPYVPKF